MKSFLGLGLGESLSLEYDMNEKMADILKWTQEGKFIY